MQGKTIVATGATSGIGERAVEALAAWAPASSSSRATRKRAEATRAKLEAIAPGLGHRAHLADLSSMADAERVRAEIAAERIANRRSDQQRGRAVRAAAGHL